MGTIVTYGAERDRQIGEIANEMDANALSKYRLKLNAKEDH